LAIAYCITDSPGCCTLATILLVQSVREIFVANAVLNAADQSFHAACVLPTRTCQSATVGPNRRTATWILWPSSHPSVVTNATTLATNSSGDSSGPPVNFGIDSIIQLSIFTRTAPYLKWDRRWTEPWNTRSRAIVGISVRHILQEYKIMHSTTYRHRQKHCHVKTILDNEAKVTANLTNEQAVTYEI
jgi:hypothetical protein